jgi:hypothetical protein
MISLFGQWVVAAATMPLLVWVIGPSQGWWSA